MRPRLLHDLIAAQADARPDGNALLSARGDVTTYETLWQSVRSVAGGLLHRGLQHFDRVAVYLPKCAEAVVSFLGATAASGSFVPVNPILKAPQVGHILLDSGAAVFISSRTRILGLAEELNRCPALKLVVSVDEPVDAVLKAATLTWDQLVASDPIERRAGLESDMAAILYTSGSTGKPKGVVLSHRNLVVGAESVASYLENGPEDRLLSVLPLSFDAGFSQLTTAFTVGASVTLLDYLLPRDVVRTCEAHGITGITGVPPLWIQLAEQTWPEAAAAHLRYFANTGGKMPRDTLGKLRRIFPQARPYLMYGLTEAFRSTYLDPAEVDRRPDSIGKAIPNVEILVVDESGRPCAPHETGELVHRGPLVALGYWNDPERTAERFRPAPGQPDGLPTDDLAVWSGDSVRMDEEGFLYFVGRRDDMIKTSGYRVSPTEIEETAFESGLVSAAVAIGVADERLGQVIWLIAVAAGRQDEDALTAFFRSRLPAYMVPANVVWLSEIPRNTNGKFDRASLKATYAAQPDIASAQAASAKA